jgi:hypothetical protein
MLGSGNDKSEVRCSFILLSAETIDRLAASVGLSYRETLAHMEGYMLYAPNSVGLVWFDLI